MLGYELLDYPSYVHRHELQGVAFAVGTRISTSGGQRCLRLQPTQSIQVKRGRFVKRFWVEAVVIVLYIPQFISALRLCRSLRCYLFRFHPHVMVLPGDEIKVECNFDTTDREEFTYFGKSTAHLEQEMCTHPTIARVRAHGLI